MILSATQTKPLTVIDLFAGAGGFSLAAHNCGLSVVAAIELDKDACQTYRNNIITSRSADTKMYERDILKLEAADLRAELKLEQGALDMLIGGPPCQGFSTHRIKNKGIDDPRNQLLLRYFDYVNELKPKLFLVENVPGLLWARHAAYLEKFQEIARQNGYVVFAPIRINAKNYGVPQNRERVFILGVREGIDASGLVWPPPATHFSPKNLEGKPVWKNASVAFEAPTPAEKNKLIAVLGLDVVNKLVFGKPVPDIAQDGSAVHMRHTPALVGRFEETPINGSRTDITFRLKCHEGDYPGHKDVYGRVRLAQPGPAITTGCFNPSKGRFLHPWLNHGISVRHAARLQTFPDDFVFVGGMTNQGKQVGNAVPVALGEQLLQHLKAFIEANPPKASKTSSSQELERKPQSKPCCEMKDQSLALEKQLAHA